MIDYRIRKHFPALPAVRWRAERILKNRTEEQIDRAAEAVEEWIGELRAQRHAEATEEFIKSEAARIYYQGGWELQYLPGGTEDPDGYPIPYSEQDIRHLLENWPSWADDRPSFPKDDMADFDTLEEVLNSEYPYGPVEGFESAVDAEFYAVLALTKVTEAEWRLHINEKQTENGIRIHAGELPWKVSDAVAVGALLVEAMEIICHAERNLSDAQLSKMRADMHAKLEMQIRQDARTEIGKAGAAAKLAKDPKQFEKAAVRECWNAWQADPSRYKGVAAFARDMLQKFERLESQPVIERWCREWKSAVITKPAE
ncbi:hypothetical protein [Variovorax sp. ZT5P30]|uniref:hypothetical protein n=1 Tax=Variovorax sp. ZT5P30 TaxID=3443735 RepID=UPI003F470927